MIESARVRLGAGARLAWIFAERCAMRTILHYVFERDGALEDVTIEADGAMPSLTALAPAADWYERELHDRFGVRFEGLDDKRPLVRVVPAESLRRPEPEAVSTVLYGPIRSGIVESARWIVQTAGESFVEVTPSMFFKHRGVEERFVGTPLDLAPFVAEFVSGVTASSHAVAFCKAAERALGIEAPPRARAARAVLVELERIAQHLDALAKLADDGSLSVGSAQTFAAKERIHRLLGAATGNRFGRGVMRVGGMRFDAMASLRQTCARELDECEHHAMTAVRGLMETQSLLDRLIGAGKLSRDAVVRFGGVGPVARGSNVSCDVRVRDGDPYAAIAGEEALEENGDTVSRTLVRASEVAASFSMVRDALNADPSGPHYVEPEMRDGSALARVESPQGELIYFVRIEGGALARVAIRPASYANWPLFAPSLPGNIFTDFSFIEHSFAASQAEVDR